MRKSALHRRVAEFLILVSLRLSLRAIGIVSADRAARLVARLFFTPRRPRRGPSEAARALTTSARGVVVRYPDGMLAGHAWGHGPTVLLVHGWEGRWTNLAAFIQPLVALGFRVVAVDGPAHGGSSGRRTDLLAYARAIASVARSEGPLYGIVAHSIGAAASTLALRGDDPVDPALRAVERLVLIGAPADISGLLDIFSTRLWLSRSTARRFRRIVEETVGHSMDALALRHNAPGGSVSTLIVHDERDEELPLADAAALASAWPAARLLRTEGLGHYRILRDAATIDRVVAFVSEGTARSLTEGQRRHARHQ